MTTLRPRRQTKVTIDSEEDEYEDNESSEDEEVTPGENSTRVSEAYRFMPMPITNSKELPFTLDRNQFKLALQEFMNIRG